MKSLFLSCILSISISQAQNIGINTPTPNAALDVKGTGNTSATFGVLVSNSSNDTSLVVSDNGNVGIGTTLPVYSLGVQSSNPIAARFSGRVAGQDAVNANEFITLQQAGTLGGNNSTAAPTMWSTPSSSSMNYIAALSYCRTLTEGNYTDWRIPYMEEIEILLEDDNIPFPSLTSGRYYWSKSISNYSSSSNGASRYKETLYFGGAFTDNSSYITQYSNGNSTPYVICVR